MNKQLRSIFTFSLLFILASCMDRLDNRNLTIFNNSNKKTYNIISQNDNMNGSGHYDEFLYDENHIYTKEDSINRFVFLEINPYVKMPSNDRPNNWDLYFKSIDDKKARLFIIQKDSVDKYGWHKIFKKNIYNKKYYLTLEDLDRMNWEIEYKEE
jgi:hypothetical protein